MAELSPDKRCESWCGSTECVHPRSCKQTSLSHARQIECEKCGNPTDGTKACTLHGERCIFAPSTTPQKPGETPRTDAFFNPRTVGEREWLTYNSVAKGLLDLARQLERDFNDAMSGAAKLYEKLKQAQSVASATLPIEPTEAMRAALRSQFHGCSNYAYEESFWHDWKVVVESLRATDGGKETNG